MIDKLLDDERLYHGRIEEGGVVHWLRENGALWSMGWRRWNGQTWEGIWRDGD
jgi:hypothetical protein